MDICVYVHKVIRCEYNNGGGGCVGGAQVKLDQLGGAHVLKGWKPLVYKSNLK